MVDATPTVDAPSKPHQRFRRTRIAASVFFAVLTVAMCVLWVRSYSIADICGVTFDHERRWNCRVGGWPDYLDIPTYKSAIWAIGKRREWDIRSASMLSNSAQGEPVFYLKRFDEHSRVIVPHLLVATFGTALPRPLGSPVASPSAPCSSPRRWWQSCWGWESGWRPEPSHWSPLFRTLRTHPWPKIDTVHAATNR